MPLTDRPLGQPALWRIGLGVVLTVLVAPACFLLMLFLGESVGILSLPPRADLLGGRAPSAILLLLLSIGVALPALALILRMLHKSSLMALFHNDPLRLRWFIWAVGIVAVVWLIQVFTPTLPVVIPNLSLSQWLIWLAPALVLILLQTATEEIIFRGYAQQMLLARFNSVWLALLIPSMFFGLGHYNPVVMGSNAWLAVAVTSIWALMMAHLTWQSGSILPAIGVHFANNVGAILLIAQPKGLPGLALYLWPDDPSGIETQFALLISCAIEIGVYMLYQVIRHLKRG